MSKFSDEIARLKKSQKQSLQKIESIGKEKSVEYPKRFNKKFKENIKKRDGGECQLCKSKEDLVCHHCDWIKVNTRDDNCVTLCRRCNGRVNANKEYYREFFKNLIFYKLGRII